MCGRFTLHTPLPDIIAQFQLEGANFTFSPNYNIAPTQKVVTLTKENALIESQLMRWGLTPPWKPGGSPLINARLETLTTRPTFKNLVESFRCLIIADGFYEWVQRNGQKQPFYITLPHQEPFAFAGLWNAKPEPSCIIITKAADEQLKDIHSRMPVILTAEEKHLWLGGPSFNEIRSALQEKKTEFNLQPVSTLVNSTRNNGPSCILPCEI